MHVGCTVHARACLHLLRDGIYHLAVGSHHQPVWQGRSGRGRASWPTTSRPSLMRAPAGCDVATCAWPLRRRSASPACLPHTLVMHLASAPAVWWGSMWWPMWWWPPRHSSSPLRMAACFTPLHQAHVHGAGTHARWPSWRSRLRWSSCSGWRRAALPAGAHSGLSGPSLCCEYILCDTAPCRGLGVLPNMLYTRWLSVGPVG